MAQSVNVSSFPNLIIDNDNVSQSFSSWKEAFELQLELAKLNMGTGPDTSASKFTDRHMMLVLLNAIGSEGRAILKTKGFNYAVPSAKYDEAMEILKAHFEREENLNVRVVKLVSARQTTGEDLRDYLLRVERLSRDADFTTTGNPRETLATVIAVNGLRDCQLRESLLQKPDLTWEELSHKLSVRGKARESEEKLQQQLHAVPGCVIKQEVDRISSDDTHSRYDIERDSPKRSARSKHYHDRKYFKNKDKRDERKSRDHFVYRDRHRSPTPANQRYKSSDSNTSRSPERNIICYHCGRPGHTISECDRVRCYNCNRRGHLASKCNVKQSGHSSSSDRSSRSPSPRSRSVRFTRDRQKAS